MAIGEGTVIFLVMMIFTYGVVYRKNQLIGSILFLAISLTSLLLDDDTNRYMSTLFVLVSLVSLTYSIITPNITKTLNSGKYRIS